MLDTLASYRHQTTDEIEASMTYDQIRLRYFMYERERERGAKVLAHKVVSLVFGE